MKLHNKGISKSSLIKRIYSLVSKIRTRGYRSTSYTQKSLFNSHKNHTASQNHPEVTEQWIVLEWFCLLLADSLYLFKTPKPSKLQWQYVLSLYFDWLCSPRKVGASVICQLNRDDLPIYPKKSEERDVWSFTNMIYTQNLKVFSPLKYPKTAIHIFRYLGIM